MKIVFIKDIPKIAKKNDIKNVADGYAKFLLANGSAVQATDVILQKIDSEKSKSAALKEKSISEFKEMATALKSGGIRVSAKVSSGKHLFSGVRAEDIAVAIEKQKGIIINSKLIKLAKPLKEVGIHTVSIEQGTMHAEVMVEIVAL